MTNYSLKGLSTVQLAGHTFFFIHLLSHFSFSVGQMMHELALNNILAEASAQQ